MKPFTFAITTIIPAFAIATAAYATCPLGQVYVMTNTAAGNAIEVFQRAPNKPLSLVQTAMTGGSGSGAGLGTQGAIALSDDQNWLFAVNAGSNEISTFFVDESGLVLTNKVASGGTMPVSVATRGPLVYTVNAGSGNISGFWRTGGQLAPIAGSSQPLSTQNAGPGQIAFSDDGDFLVVTEKNTNLIDVFPVNDNGVAQPPSYEPSTGQTPYGFAFTYRERIVVSDAVGGATGAGAMTSYKLGPNGHLSVLSGSVPDEHTAPCWVAITGDGVYAYTTNTGDGTVSSYLIGPTGTLSLLTGPGYTASLGSGAKPIDLGLSGGSRFLFVLLSGTQSIATIKVGDHGMLIPAGTVSDLPASASGLVAQ